jgi:hypothetical protein
MQIRHLISSALVVALLQAVSPAMAADADTPKSKPAAVATRAGNAIERGAKRAGNAVARGATKTGKAIKRGATRTGNGIKRGAAKVGLANGEKAPPPKP